jgi:hypothetical protein
MNEVQEYILKRAMQKVANAEEQNKLKNLPKTMPNEYYQNRIDSYLSNNDVYPIDRRGDYRNLYEILDAYHPVPGSRWDTSIDKVRRTQAEDYLRGMNLIPGSDKWNRALQFLIQHGKINQYNYLNPEDPMDVPKVDNKIFDAQEQKQLQRSGTDIAYNDNYKKFSGNA